MLLSNLIPKKLQNTYSHFVITLRKMVEYILYHISGPPEKVKLVFKDSKTTAEILHSQVTFLSFCTFQDKTFTD